MTRADVAAAARSFVQARELFRLTVQKFLGIRGNSASIARDLQISKAYVSEIRHGGKISDSVVEKLEEMK